MVAGRREVIGMTMKRRRKLIFERAYVVRRQESLLLPEHMQCLPGGLSWCPIRYQWLRLQYSLNVIVSKKKRNFMLCLRW